MFWKQLMSNKKRSCIYGAIIFLILFASIFCYEYASEKNVIITTTPDAFLPVSALNSIAETNHEEMYFFLDITPAPWPKEAKEIYKAIKSNHTVKVVVIKQNKSKMEINFLAGLSEGGHLRARVKSREEKDLIIKYLFYGL